MLRFFDIALSAVGLLVASPVMVILTLLCFLDTGSPIFRQVRVGRWQQSFVLVKFRTMRLHTTSVATHLVDARAVTRLGSFLRRVKLDELPQLWNVLKGDMSLVGPRPCLLSQKELIRERSILRVFDARPGITGLAQVRGIDMSTPSYLAKTDAEMLADLSIGTYSRLLLATVIGRGTGDRIRPDNAR